jgi:hypothetical protein
MLERGEDGEAYQSHFVFGGEMRAHYAAHGHSVAGYVGPCWCRWLLLDIDSADLSAALADACRLVTYLHQRYPECEGSVPVWFSGNKGFHIAVELAHEPPPAVGFNRTAGALAAAIAARAGVKIDASIYDVNHIIRVPNTRHPKSGLFKRLLTADELFALDVEGIRRHAAHPAGDGIPLVRTPQQQLAADWRDASRVAVMTDPLSVARSRAAQRAAVGAGQRPGPDELAAAGADQRAPKYFVDFLRFGVDVGERHHTLFRCAAWLTEQGAPPPLVSALLTEPGCDVGLPPKEVARQIACGVEHARRQRAGTPGDGGPPA